MENQIYAAGGSLYKSVVFKENEFWVSINKVGNLEKFEKAVKSGGMMQSAVAMPMSTVTGVSFNNGSSNMKIKYLNEKGKEKSFSVTSSVEKVNALGHHLGAKLGMTKEEKVEGKFGKISASLFGLLIVVGTVIMTINMEGSSELAQSGSRRAKGVEAILKLIVNTIGQTGVIIIGALLSLYIIYQLIKGLKNPANDIIYTK